METADLLTHAVSAGGGSLTAGWLLRTLFKAWMKKHDDLAKSVVKLTEAVQDLRVEAVKTGVAVAGMGDALRKMQELDKLTAVLDHRVGEAEADLNGLGGKIRAMESS